jgi:hypothetical protein
VGNDLVRIFDASIELMTTEKILSLRVGCVLSKEITIGRLQKGPAIFEIYGEGIINLVPVAEYPILECLRVFATLKSRALLIL